MTKNPKYELFASQLLELRSSQRKLKSALRGKRAARKSLTIPQRSAVLGKTGGRCHICGGMINGAWQADHVLAYSGGGQHAEDNYLPAHALCNTYRWDHSAEEFQLILKLGVFVRTQIERRTRLGGQVGEHFLAHERRRERRRVRAAQ
jgi:hypothetical protein